MTATQASTTREPRLIESTPLIGDPDASSAGSFRPHGSPRMIARRRS